eukprot:1357620-Amphidinium_carterae.1
MMRSTYASSGAVFESIQHHTPCSSSVLQVAEKESDILDLSNHAPDDALQFRLEQIEADGMLHSIVAESQPEIASAEDANLNASVGRPKLLRPIKLLRVECSGIFHPVQFSRHDIQSTGLEAPRLGPLDLMDAELALEFAMEAGGDSPEPRMKSITVQPGLLGITLHNATGLVDQVSAGSQCAVAGGKSCCRWKGPLVNQFSLKLSRLFIWFCCPLHCLQLRNQIVIIALSIAALPKNGVPVPHRKLK